MRFRVTSSDSSEGFNAGTDILLPNQGPWIMALKTLGEKQFAAVWEVLLRDGSLSDALVSLDVNPICPSINRYIQPPARLEALKQSIQTLDSARLCPADYLNLAGGRP